MVINVTSDNQKQDKTERGYNGVPAFPEFKATWLYMFRE